jgi:hypothetical protein
MPATLRWGLAILVAAPLVQLVPLPASLWSALPGHAPYARVPGIAAPHPHSPQSARHRHRFEVRGGLHARSQDGQIAGVLVETRFISSKPDLFIAGIGLNVNVAPDEFPPELRGTATSLRIEAASPVDRGRALDALLERLAERFSPGPESRAEVLRAYRERDALSGRRIVWSAGATKLEGDAQGVDERGNLVVFTDGGERLALEAGEVHLSLNR